MKSVDYIKDKLSQILDIFPEIGCKYDFDEFSSSHIIEITPTDFYTSNQEFKEQEFKLIRDFIEKYPFENITFITGEDFYKIEKTIFEKNPQISFVNVPLFEYLLKQNFSVSPEYLNIILNSNMIVTNDFLTSIKNTDNSLLFAQSSIIVQPLKPQKPAEVPDESSNHALAA